MTRTAKLAIIGAGTAGLTALKEAQRYTDDIVLINDGPYGTTCARVGCMPSKALLAAAHGFERRHFLAQAGIEGTHSLSVDLPAVMKRVRLLRDRFTRGPINLADSLGEQSIEGRPRFLDANTLEVNGERIQVEATVIATGTRPVVPQPWRALGERVVTSDDIFELEDPGQRVAVVGLGAIGAELGQALARLGLQVHAYTRGVSVAGLSDPVVNESMLEALRRDMHAETATDVRVEDVDGQRVRVLAGEDAHEVDWVLAALGRRPNVEGLELEAAGAPVDGHGVPTFDPDTLRVGELPIFIAGDVSGQRPLMHEAADEGRIAAYHALNPDTECLARRVPLGMVFTHPNTARVGLAYHELPAGRFVIGEADFSRQPRALMAGENEGRLHVYVDSDTRRLIGAEMAIPGGEHMAHLLAWSIQQSQTVDDLLQMPYYHPVLEEGLRAAVQSARRQLGTERSMPDLPLCHEAADWALGGG